MDKAVEIAVKTVPTLLMLLRQFLAFIDTERERSGKTTAQIFEQAGVRLEQNELNLMNDLVKYAPTNDGE